MGTCANPNELSFLGSGVPLFFDYNCFIMLALGICFAIYGGYAIYKNSKENYCDVKNIEKEDYCGAKWKTLTAAGNRDLSEIDKLEKWLASLLLFLLLVIRIIFF